MGFVSNHGYSWRLDYIGLVLGNELEHVTHHPPACFELHVKNVLALGVQRIELGHVSDAGKHMIQKHLRPKRGWSAPARKTVLGENSKHRSQDIAVRVQDPGSNQGVDLEGNSKH